MNHLPCHQAHHYAFHKLNNNHHNRRGNHNQHHKLNNNHHNRRGNHNQRHNQRTINQAGLRQAASLTHKMVGHAVVAEDASQGA